jgi:carbonic anhydrase
MSDALTAAPAEEKRPAAPAAAPHAAEKKSKLLALLLGFQVLVAGAVGVLVFRHVSAPPAPPAAEAKVADHEGTHEEPAAKGLEASGKAAAAKAVAAKDPHADPHAAPAADALVGPASGLADRLTWAADGHAIWRELELGNERFVTGKLAPHDVGARRTAVAKGQHPPAMILTCADSRVPPELIFDQGLGDLFVVRTAGNVADPVVMASFEYAAEHLGARLLVVLGHKKCGAVAAAVQGGEAPTENLKALLGEIAPSVEKLRDRVGDDVLPQRAMEENALHEAERMVEGSPLLKDRVEKHQLEVIAAAYDLDTGKVVVLHPQLTSLDPVATPEPQQASAHGAARAGHGPAARAEHKAH